MSVMFVPQEKYPYNFHAVSIGEIKNKGDGSSFVSEG